MNWFYRFKLHFQDKQKTSFAHDRQLETWGYYGMSVCEQHVPSHPCSSCRDALWTCQTSDARCSSLWWVNLSHRIHCDGCSSFPGPGKPAHVKSNSERKGGGGNELQLNKNRQVSILCNMQCSQNGRALRKSPLKNQNPPLFGLTRGAWRPLFWVFHVIVVHTLHTQANWITDTLYSVHYLWIYV